MTEFDPARFSHYISSGRWEFARQAVTANIAKCGPASHYFYNRGVCSLALGEVERAQQDFQSACEVAPDVSANSIMLGVAMWWGGSHGGAVGAWKSALDAKWVDAAGGVEGPAMLFFASKRRPGIFPKERSLALLRERWSPRLVKIWPGPIAGFLLGEMDHDTFLVRQTFANSILEEKRLCQAHFWVATSLLGQLGAEHYAEHLRASIKPTQHNVAIFKAEYWLARAELEPLTTT